MIACGRRHSLAYQPKSKKLYSWGLNGSGQLGHLVGGEKGTSSPFSIKTLENENIISIFCGGDQSFAFVIPNSESLPSPSPLPRLEISKLTKPIIKYLLDNAQISGNYGTLQHYVFFSSFFPPFLSFLSFLSFFFFFIFNLYFFSNKKYSKINFQLGRNCFLFNKLFKFKFFII